MTKERKDLLVFGYGLAIILSFIGWRNYVHHGVGLLPIVLFFCAGVFAIISLIRVEILKPFYKKWMVGAHFIGTIISGILLAVIFYCVFGITGIILRILGKDILDQRINKEAKSYWSLRELKPFDRKQYTSQF